MTDAAAGHAVVPLPSIRLDAFPTSGWSGGQLASPAVASGAAMDRDVHDPEWLVRKR
jgi:hypothetical protein